MNSAGHEERGRNWLEEQLEMLGNLRNGNPRDPSFKLWRQNTLTVLQRIWPGEHARSEVFRRITFSPVTARPDARTAREWYERGCSEAADFLRSLLTEVDAIGIPDPAKDSAAHEHGGIGREDDFPVLELPHFDAPAPAAEEDTGFVLLDADGTAAALAPEQPGAAAEDSGAPAPPTLRVESRSPAAPAGAPEEPAGSAPPMLPARTRHSRPAPVASQSSLPSMPETPGAPPQGPVPSGAAPPAAPPRLPAAKRTEARRPGPVDRRASRPARAKRASSEPRLADMLGLDKLGREAHPEPAPPPPAPVVEAPVVAAAPPPAPVVEAPVAAAPPPAPVVEAPVAAAPPPAPVVEAPVVAAPPPPAAVVVPEMPAPPAPPAEAAEHREDFAQATADFMRNSPVLGLQGRPVQRVSDATQFLDPDAVALATLAADVGRFVPDDAAREALRTAMVEFAMQVEARSPEWSALRDLVASAMAYPELARRLMPIVLPWLGRAA